MTYRWQYPGSAVEFDDKESAEAWLSENWPNLLDSGIDQVTLFEDGTLLYAMDLNPPE